MIDRNDMPPRIAALPTDERGYPIPKFVAVVNGKPDFRVVDPEHWRRCMVFRRCWICGEPLGRHVAFVCGPSSAVNHVTSEPGSHLDCALYALRTCPFIMFPKRARDEAPEGVEMSTATIMVERNPGVWALWVTSEFKPFAIADTARVRLGKPSRIDWFERGGHASFEAVLRGITTAMDALPPGSGARQYYADFIAGAAGHPLMPRAA